MSSLTGRRISEDLRYELVDAARVSEASNRPRSLLFLATAVFLISGIALIVTLRGRESAVRQYEIQSDRMRTTAELKVQAEAIERQRGSADASRNDPIPDQFSRIEQAARDAGLRDKPPIPDPRNTVIGGAVRRQYQYTMRDPSLEALLEWVEASRRRVPGLEVSGIEIVPEAKLWKFTVTFVRWERSS